MNVPNKNGKRIEKTLAGSWKISSHFFITYNRENFEWCSTFLTVSGGWNSATCTRNKVLESGGFLKHFSKISDKHKEQSAGGVQSKDVLKNFVKFTEIHFFRSLLFNKVVGWKL